MGLINQEQIVNQWTGETVTNTYMYLSNVTISKESGTYTATGTFKCFFTKAARDANMNPFNCFLIIKIINDSNELLNIFTYFYDQCRLQYPNCIVD